MRKNEERGFWDVIEMITNDLLGGIYTLALETNNDHHSGLLICYTRITNCNNINILLEHSRRFL